MTRGRCARGRLGARGGGPDSQAGANLLRVVLARRVLVEESAPAPTVRTARVEHVRILRLRRRLARDANPEVLNLEVRLTLVEVIQAVEGADRVGVAPYTGGTAPSTRRARDLASESGTCTHARECSRADRNPEQ